MLKVTVTPPTTDNGAIQCLFNNLDFFLSHQSEILSVPEYCNILVKGCFVAGLYVGGHHLYLGDLLNLWETTAWHTGDRYYYSIIGSPLSGRNQAHYWDNAQKKICVAPYSNGKQGFVGLWIPASKHIERTLLVTNTGTNIRPSVSKLDIYTLLSQLKQQSR